MAENIELQESVLGWEKSQSYTDQEKQWIYQIATHLRMRESALDPTERQDMGLYVRAAASLYELAKKLASSPTRFRHNSMDSWLRILTHHHFNFIAATEETLRVNVYDTTAKKPKTEEEREYPTEKVIEITATSVQGDPRPGDNGTS